MAVKVIKAGVLPSTRLLGLTCRHCGCEFTFNPPDAKYVSDQRDGDYYSIDCPTCGKQCTHTARHGMGR